MKRIIIFGLGLLIIPFATLADIKPMIVTTVTPDDAWLSPSDTLRWSTPDSIRPTMFYLIVDRQQKWFLEYRSFVLVNEITDKLIGKVNWQVKIAYVYQDSLLDGKGPRRSFNLGSPVISAQNFPNPFNPITTIIFNLPEPQFVVLKIYDLHGREIETLANGLKDHGEHKINWNGGSVPSGVYFYILRAGNKVIRKKMTLLR